MGQFDHWSHNIRLPCLKSKSFSVKYIIYFHSFQAMSTPKPFPLRRRIGSWQGYYYAAAYLILIPQSEGRYSTYIKNMPYPRTSVPFATSGPVQVATCIVPTSPAVHFSGRAHFIIVAAKVMAINHVTWTVSSSTHSRILTPGFLNRSGMQQDSRATDHFLQMGV
jgi:hypothetical protein